MKIDKVIIVDGKLVYSGKLSDGDWTTAQKDLEKEQQLLEKERIRQIDEIKNILESR